MVENDGKSGSAVETWPNDKAGIWVFRPFLKPTTVTLFCNCIFLIWWWSN